MLHLTLKLCVICRRAIEMGYVRVRLDVLDQRCENANRLLWVRTCVAEKIRQGRTV